MPNKIPGPKQDQRHKNSIALRRTPWGGGAHGPPRFSAESLQGTLVPKSTELPTKRTAPGSAIANMIQERSSDPRESSATQPTLLSKQQKGHKADKTGPVHIPYNDADKGRKLADTSPHTRKRARVVSRAANGTRADTGPRLGNSRSARFLNLRIAVRHCGSHKQIR